MDYKSEIKYKKVNYNMIIYCRELQSEPRGGALEVKINSMGGRTCFDGWDRIEKINLKKNLAFFFGNSAEPF